MLKVSEIFGPTIQGEGKSIGKKVLFLRLAMCNLHCVWCDTAYTWRFDTKHPHNDNVVYHREDEIHEMEWEEVFDQIHNLAYFERKAIDAVKALVISGGEPLLQQKQLIPLLQKLKERGYWIEIETNGTVRPLPQVLELLDQVNCSPKLSNAGDPLSLREKKQALEVLPASEKTNFKFVVSDARDVEEALSLVSRFGMKQVYLMPEGRTVAELQKHEDFVKKVCEQKGFTFTPRQHIILFGAKRAV